MFRKIVTTEAEGLDLCIIQTAFGYHVRYGLQTSAKFVSLSGALFEYQACLRHALAADLEGEMDVA